jgi:hypothetical protein
VASPDHRSDALSDPLFGLPDAPSGVGTIRSMYPLTLLEGQGMGTAYEYYSKLRVMARVFARTGAPRSVLVLGLPEKHGYDLDLVLLAHHLRLVVCEDRREVLAGFRRALERLPAELAWRPYASPDAASGSAVETIEVNSLTDCLDGQRFDWIISTASVQRLPNEGIVAYLQNARQMADHILLFIPNSGNRAHLTLSGLRGLDLDEMLALCRHAGIDPGPQRPSALLAAGYCDIPPFPPGLQRSTEAKERAMHSPVETLAMWCLQWWCRGESWMPRALQKRLAHLIYVALDLCEDAS